MSTYDIDSLSSAERFALWSLRLALSPQIESDKAHHALDSGFRAAGVTQALPDFMDLAHVLTLAWHEVQYVPDIHCTCCRCVGDDELQLLQAMAALQAGQVELAVAYLDAMLPAVAVGRALPHAVYVAGVLCSVGLTLRCWQFEAANAPVFATQRRPSLH
ncbi:MAG TPA: hypothetical protein VNQ81_09815 [Povalibacter sp.]|nr:hypothetical protein [Povalibacter sp.]